MAERDRIVESGRGKAAQVLAAAGKLFQARGYGATSMDEVARAAGVSKTTVYAHFAGKKELFAAVIASSAEWITDEMTAATAGGTTFEQRLCLLARRILGFLLEPGTLGMFRVVVAEAAHFPELGRAFYHAGPARVNDYLKGYFSAAVERDELSIDDLGTAAAQFVALVKGDLHLRCLFEPALAPDATDLDRQAEVAAAAFLRIYGTAWSDGSDSCQPPPSAR